MQEVLTSLDIAIKFEIALNSFHTVLMTTCLVEGFVMTILFGFFLRAPSNMWFFLLHVPHIIRCICGYSISQKVPYAQDIVAAIKKKATEDKTK